MYNRTLVDELIKEFSLESVAKFCEIEARKYELIAQSKADEESKLEALYERDWWAVESENLNLQQKIKS